jgi:hypothetical protein
VQFLLCIGYQRRRLIGGKGVIVTLSFELGGGDSVVSGICLQVSAAFVCCSLSASIARHRQQYRFLTAEIAQFDRAAFWTMKICFGYPYILLSYYCLPSPVKKQLSPLRYSTS